VSAWRSPSVSLFDRDVRTLRSIRELAALLEEMAKVKPSRLYVTPKRSV